MAEEQRWPEPVYLTKDHAINMTLRDYFAAKAMQGLIERETTGAFNFETHPDDPWRVAMWAYDVADQMLKVRNEK